VNIEFGAGAEAMIGIVRVAGDGPQVCFGLPGSRPTAFESPEGSRVGPLTLRRPPEED
jgi:hypothetical protein